MQEHAEDIHSRPKVQCPACFHALDENEQVCPNCGVRAERSGRVPVGGEGS